MRVEIGIAVTLMGKDVSGREFRENTRTIVVNKHGAKIATAHRLAIGAEVLVENRKLGKRARAKVAWLGDSQSPKDPLQVGIQLYEAENIWGIEFPPDDGKDAPRKIFVPAERAARDPSPMPSIAAPKEITATEPPSASLAPSAERTPEMTASSIRDAMDAAERDFEKRLTTLATQIGNQTAASMQAAADAIEQKLSGSMDDKLQAAIEKLAAAHRDLDEILEGLAAAKQVTLQEAQRALSEFQTSAARAVNAGTEELSARISKDLNDRLAGLGASLAQQISQTTGLLNEECMQLISQTREQLAGASKQAAEEALATSERALQDRMRESRAEADEEIKKLSAGALDRLRQELAELVEENHRQAQERLKQLTATFLEESLSELKGKAARATEETLAGKSSELKDVFFEDTRRRLSNLSKSTAEGMNKEALAGIDRYRTELQKRAEEELDAAAERLKKASEGAVEQATQLLRSSLAGVFSSFSPAAKGPAAKDQS